MLTDEIITEFRNHGRADFLETNGSSFVKRYEDAARKGYSVDSIDELGALHMAYFHAYFKVWFGDDLDLDSCSNPKSVFQLIKNRIEERGCHELWFPAKELNECIKKEICALKAYFLHEVTLKFSTTTLTERTTAFRVVGIYDRDPKGPWGLKKEFL